MFLLKPSMFQVRDFIDMTDVTTLASTKEVDLSEHGSLKDLMLLLKPLAVQAQTRQQILETPQYCLGFLVQHVENYHQPLWYHLW